MGAPSRNPCQGIRWSFSSGLDLKVCFQIIFHGISVMFRVIAWLLFQKRIAFYKNSASVQPMEWRETSQNWTRWPGEISSKKDPYLKNLFTCMKFFIFLLQEIEPRVAEELCRLFPEDTGIELTPILYKSKRAARNVKPKMPQQTIMRGRFRGSGRRGGGDAFPRYSECLCLGLAWTFTVLILQGLSSVNKDFMRTVISPSFPVSLCLTNTHRHSKCPCTSMDVSACCA